MEFATPAAPEVIAATVEALKSRGVTAEETATGRDALDRLRVLLPAGASLSTGASLTLKEIGFEELLVSGTHPWKNLKAEIGAEKDPARQRLLRRQSVLADYYLGSVHAVVQTGELLWASLTGSQLSAYAYGASNVIWVVGAQKIVPTVEAGMRRIREYIFPHEDARQKAATGGRTGSGIGKILIFEREPPFLGRTLHLLIVRERLGD